MAFDENVDVGSSDEENVEDNNEMDVVDDSSDDGSEESGDEQPVSRVYLPSHDADQSVELEHEESAYICYHAIKAGAPCLSFDVVPDDLGDNRADRFPLTMSVLGGTQVPSVLGNNLLVMRLSNMHRNKEQKEEEEEEEEEEDSDDEEEERKKPVLECASIPHEGCVNRVKVRILGEEPYAASWSEKGKVHLWNLSRPVTAVNDSRALAAFIQNKETVQPVFTFAGHLQEGYAVEWSPLVPGVLATGDCKSNIHLWKPLEGGSWHVDQRPFSAHTDSVEDLQWSPNESNVLASCSTDKSIRVWDVRVAPNKACMLTRSDAHDSDVNVISWNKSEPFILSGGDDGKLRVWDLRKFPEGDPICTLKYHTGPITSVEWHPMDHSVFAAASADNVLSQWDLAVERDEAEGETEEEELRALPPQLLFLHQGQKEIKELHWHPQMPGVLLSTAENGINILRTISI